MDLIQAGQFWDFLSTEIATVFDRMKDTYIMFPDGAHSVWELAVSGAVASAVLTLLGFSTSKDDISDDDNN